MSKCCVEMKIDRSDSIETAIRTNPLNIEPDIKIFLRKKGVSYKDIIISRDDILIEDLIPGSDLRFPTVAAPKYGYYEQMGNAKYYNRFWPKGQVLTIKFMEGVSELIRKKIRPHINKWRAHVNLDIKYVKDYENAEVRIEVISNKNVPSKTFTGTDAKHFQKNQNMSTMLLTGISNNTPQDIVAFTVLHEFGHALGLVHAHQEPDAKIPWKKADIVYRYFREKFSMSDIETDMNYLNTYSRDNLVTNGYTPYSVMHSYIPAELVTDHKERLANSQLSSKDIAIVKQIYG